MDVSSLLIVVAMISTVEVGEGDGTIDEADVGTDLVSCIGNGLSMLACDVEVASLELTSAGENVKKPLPSSAEVASLELTSAGENVEKPLPSSAGTVLVIVGKIVSMGAAVGETEADEQVQFGAKSKQKSGQISMS